MNDELETLLNCGAMFDETSIADEIFNEVEDFECDSVFVDSLSFFSVPVVLVSKVLVDDVKYSLLRETLLLLCSGDNDEVDEIVDEVEISFSSVSSESSSINDDWLRIVDEVVVDGVYEVVDSIEEEEKEEEELDDDDDKVDDGIDGIDKDLETLESELGTLPLTSEANSAWAILTLPLTSPSTALIDSQVPELSP